MKEIKSPARFGKRAALAALIGKRAPNQPMGGDKYQDEAVSYTDDEFLALLRRLGERVMLERAREISNLPPLARNMGKSEK